MEHRHHRRTRRRGQLRRPASPPGGRPVRPAGEYVEVVLKLCGQLGGRRRGHARPTGQWADPARLHPPRHHGTHFDVSSYLPFPRSPQGHPFLTQAGSSPPGIALAARYADAVFTPLADIAAGVAFRQSLRAQAAGYGRDPGQVRVLPGLSFLLAGTDAEARALKDELEAAASSEFRWRNLANLAGWTTPPSTPTRRSRPTARWRSQDELRHLHLQDGRRGTGGHVPGRGPEAVGPTRRPGLHRHSGGHGPAHHRLVARRSRRRVHHHAEYPARPAGRIRSTMWCPSCKRAASPAPNTPAPPCATISACPGLHGRRRRLPAGR